MISAMAFSARSLDDEPLRDSAVKAADFILTKMKDDQGRLLHRWRDGESAIPGFLDDYAFFIHGLTELYRATKDKKYLNAATKLTQDAQNKFAPKTGGGYFDTLADQGDLFVRTRSKYDGAVPSGNSRMIFDLVDLFELTGDEKYIKRARIDLESFSGAGKSQG